MAASFARAPNFARAAAMLDGAAPSSRIKPSTDRRRFYRAPIEVGGRVLMHGVERDCRTMDMSPGGARLMAASTPKAGERVVLYLDTIGRVPAQITRASDEGFGVLFEATAHKREKLAEQLIWLMNKDRLGLDEASLASGTVKAANSVSITLEDGRALHCEVMDFSMVGASLRTAQRKPEIGAWVRIGQTYGRVSRYLPDGFAVDFSSIRPQ